MFEYIILLSNVNKRLTLNRATNNKGEQVLLHENEITLQAFE